MPKGHRKKGENRLFSLKPGFRQSWSRTKVLELGQLCNILFFLSFLGSVIKQCILFEIFLQFFLPPPYTKLKIGKKNLDTRVQLCLWGEGRGWACQCKLENALEMQSVSRLWSMIVDPSKSVGMRDNIFSRLLRLSTPSITDEVTHLINYFITTQSIPTEWKSSNIISVDKKGSKSEKSNYRPVSI